MMETLAIFGNWQGYLEKPIDKKYKMEGKNKPVEENV